MRPNPTSHPTLRERVRATRQASRLAIRALLHHRMGSAMPLVVVVLLISYAGMVLGLLSPLALLPRSVQIVPFIYPLF
jgi:hypothetical protein